ncbi:uncharacterized protein LOC130934640 [Arachis stenosperma]|uniref:uncharacterized protein LOC130934640 n=1 Tax=Arachis stenosperma TaxID=217475 RepID=UPI0025AB800A|nr:uncharacterized protein LOC130934640 [Arachis stenosperma]
MEEKLKHLGTPNQRRIMKNRAKGKTSNAKFVYNDIMLKPYVSNYVIVTIVVVMMMGKVKMVVENESGDFTNPRGLDAINLNDDDIEDRRQDNIQHWHWEEDEMLISAWLNVSTDPIVGTDQKGKTFWSRIHSYCVEFCSDMTMGVVAYKKRWYKINKAVAQFAGCYDQASRNIRSGSNADDIKELAYKLYSGSNNDINVLDRSPVFDDILNDRAPEVNYTINGNSYTMGYYLAYGIYPEWATFVKSISKPQGEKRKLFAQYQEGKRKDMEQAFRVLQARFAIIRGPARFWKKKKLANIMKACIILHNMIVEDERDTYVKNFAQGLEYNDVENGLSQPQLGEEDFALYHQFLQRNAQLRNRQQHRQLKEDLIEHIWQFHNACHQL